MLKIKQFYDTGLAHASYAVLSEGKMAVVDPGRDCNPYLDYARAHEAKLVTILETHPHADFVSGHLELHQISGATIYTSRLTKAAYPHTTFDEGDELPLGSVRLLALNTPGHSPDSICILLLDEDGRQHSLFTGDTLFVGDVGRPDLRETAEDLETQREHLARQMYKSTRQIIMKLDRNVMIYPAHGAGSLCGKNISTERTSTLGAELETNKALQEMTEEAFVQMLLEDQPFVPKYFSYNVELNKQGAPALEESLARIPRLENPGDLQEGLLVVDSRDQLKFKNRHTLGAINIMQGEKFETWLGSILDPEEPFCLIAETENELESLIRKTAKIGYEKNIRGALANATPGHEHDLFIILEHFRVAPQNYTVVDVRNEAEVKRGKIFDHALVIPLHQLRERGHEVPTDKPVVVHCAGGYRSAAAFSILESQLPQARVYDLGDAVKEFK